MSFFLFSVNKSSIIFKNTIFFNLLPMICETRNPTYNPDDRPASFMWFIVFKFWIFTWLKSDLSEERINGRGMQMVEYWRARGVLSFWIKFEQGSHELNLTQKEGGFIDVYSNDILDDLIKVYNCTSLSLKSLWIWSVGPCQANWIIWSFNHSKIGIFVDKEVR